MKVRVLEVTVGLLFLKLRFTFFFLDESYGLGLFISLGWVCFGCLLSLFGVGLDSGRPVIYRNLNTNLLYNKWILGVFIKCILCGVFFINSGPILGILVKLPINNLSCQGLK